MVDDRALAHDIVDDDQRAGPRKPQRKGEIGGVVGLVGVVRGRDMAPDFWRVKRLFTMPSIL